jgi:glycosyltransferase involved in cell wall biosynthesis
MKISYIILTHNRLETLIYHVKSIRLQDYLCDKLEVIVADDGSTDGTREYCEKSKFVDIYVNTGNEEKATPARARNIGMEKATGDLLVFADDDCLPHPLILQEYQKTKQGICSVGYRSSLKDRLGFHPVLFNPQCHLEAGRPQEYYKRAVNNAFIWHHFSSGSFAIRKEDLKGVKFDEEFEGYGYEDRYFAKQLADQGIKFEFLYTAIIYHDHSASQQDPEKKEKERIKNKEMFLKKLNEKQED